jgi:hypothetical protein
MSAARDTAGVSHPRRWLRLSLILTVALLGAALAGPVGTALAAHQRSRQA